MIYFDNGATSYPKPTSVIRSSYDAIKNYSFNIGRSGYRYSLKSAEKIYTVRESIANMFSFKPENVVFTKNCTEALNIAILGSVNKGDHIIISSLEHNSVSRVVQSLYDNGVCDYDIARFSFDKEECITNFKMLIKRNTRLIICMYASNVFGVTFPIKEIGELCSQYGIRFIVDAAQGAGIADINAVRDNIDILCAPGHKCLFGPMGTGFMAVKEGVLLKPYSFGGTGSNSLSLKQPDFLPDRFESGTLNNSGIIALGKGIEFINTTGIENIYNHDLSLAQYMYDYLSSIPEAELYTPRPDKSFMPIISFNYKDYSSEKTAALLSEYDICTRAGYHCSPLAHKHFNTLERGTVRLSMGYFNTVSDCYKFFNIVKKL